MSKYTDDFWSTNDTAWVADTSGPMLTKTLKQAGVSSRFGEKMDRRYNYVLLVGIAIAIALRKAGMRKEYVNATLQYFFDPKLTVKVFQRRMSEGCKTFIVSPTGRGGMLTLNRVSRMIAENPEAMSICGIINMEHVLKNVEARLDFHMSQQAQEATA